MNTLINRIHTLDSNQGEPEEVFVTPHHDFSVDGEALNLAVYVPGVEATGLELCLYQDQLIVTARRHRMVRPNWGTLRLECAQHDYRVKIKLGFRALPASIRADIQDGILRIRIGEAQPAEALAADAA